MRNKPLALLLVGIATLGVVAWLVLRTSRPARPVAAGPERTTNAERAESHVDSTNVDGLPSAVVASPLADPRPSPSTARENAAAETIVLYGFVRPAEGMSPPTEPAYVAVVDSHGERVQSSASAEGAYSVSGLRPGHYHLTAGAQPTGEAKADLDLALAENPKRYDITLSEKLSLLVELIDRDGKPVAPKAWLGAIATRERPGDWIDESPNMDVYEVGRFGNDVGRSTMAVGCLGRLDVEVAPPVFVSLLHNQRVLATQRIEAPRREVVFVVDADSPLLQTAKIRAHFVDQAGQEVPKVWAMLNGGSSTRTGKSDGGTFVWSGLPPGWYRVQVHAKGFEEPDVECRVEPGEDKDLGNITLAPEQWISGIIVEPSKTSERIDLSCDPYDPDAAPDASYYRYKSFTMYATEADRTFRIAGRSRGLYVLKCNERQASYGIWARVVDTRSGPVENVRVDLVPGVPVLVRPSGEDWHSLRYRITDETGVPYVESQLYGIDPVRILLGPGRYRVEVRVGPGEPTRKEFTVGSEQVDLALP